MGASPESGEARPRIQLSHWPATETAPDSVSNRRRAGPISDHLFEPVPDDGERTKRTNLSRTSHTPEPWIPGFDPSVSVKLRYSEAAGTVDADFPVERRHRLPMRANNRDCPVRSLHSSSPSEDSIRRSRRRLLGVEKALGILVSRPNYARTRQNGSRCAPSFRSPLVLSLAALRLFLLWFHVSV